MHKTLYANRAFWLYGTSRETVKATKRVYFREVSLLLSDSLFPERLTTGDSSQRHTESVSYNERLMKMLEDDYHLGVTGKK